MTEARWGRRLSIGAMILTVAMALAFAAAYSLNRRIVITEGLGDTLFILNIGYAISEGLLPHRDFPYFYGGLVEHLTAFWLGVLRGAPSALDFVMLSLLAICVALASPLVLRRSGDVSGAFLMLLLAALFFTRTAFETPDFYVLEHSHFMMYNRAGWGFVAVMLYAAYERCFVTRRSSPEVTTAVVFGLCVFFIAWTKATFGVVVAAVYLYMLFLRDIRFLVVSLAVFLAALLLVGMTPLFGPLAFLRSIDFFLLQAGLERDASFGPLRKAAWSALPLLAPLALLGASYAFMAVKPDLLRRRILFYGMILAGLFIAMLATGSFKIEQVRSPIAALLSLLVLRDALAIDARWRERLRSAAIPAILIAALVLPNLASGAAYTAKKILSQPIPSATNGPLDEIIVDPTAPYFADGEEIRAVSRAIRSTGGDIELEGDLALYTAVRDGVQLAQHAGVQSPDTIVSLTTLYFPYLLGAQPVPEFPYYGRKAWHSANGFTIPQSVEYVLVPQSPANTELVQGYGREIDEHFALMESSLFWELYRRRAIEPPPSD